MIGDRRFSVLIVNVVMEDRRRTLLAKLEACVWRDVKSLRAVVRRDYRAVVLAGSRAGDVEPASVNIHGLAEVNADRGIVRCIQPTCERVGRDDRGVDHRRGWLLDGQTDRIAAGTQLTVNDRERNRLWTRHGERRDCRYVREDVVACDGITAVKTIIKELLASGTTNRRKIRSYDNTAARRICPQCNGHCQRRRCTRQG